jgi:putative transposase
MNVHVERFHRSLKEDECLDRMILFGERSVRNAIREFLLHYHSERNHQGLDNTIIEPDDVGLESGEVTCHERLGGMLRYYYRDAA